AVAPPRDPGRRRQAAPRGRRDGATRDRYADVAAGAVTTGASRATAVLTGVAFLALYGATRVEVHRFDALSYMLAAQSGSSRFDPHHLLFTRLAWLFQSDGDTDRLIVAMQGLSAVCAAVGLGLFCRLLQHLSHRASAWWALVGTGLLGVSSSFW